METPVPSEATPPAAPSLPVRDCHALQIWGNMHWHFPVWSMAAMNGFAGKSLILLLRGHEAGEQGYAFCARPWSSTQQDLERWFQPYAIANGIDPLSFVRSMTI
jgi:hypothetical protein